MKKIFVLNQLINVPYEGTLSITKKVSTSVEILKNEVPEHLAWKQFNDEIGRHYVSTVFTENDGLYECECSYEIKEIEFLG